VQLSGKHFDEPLQPATLVALSRRQALMETAGPMAAYANLLLRLAPEGENEKPAELYAKTLRRVGESGARWQIHFTSVPPAVRARLDRLAGHNPGSLAVPPQA
jgi:hypothetical protein